MYEEVTMHTFQDRFNAIRPDNFSYDGLTALFNYLEELEEDTDNKQELDVIALCCEYTEYESLEEFHKEFDKEDYPDIESIQDATTFVRVGDCGFIIGSL
jgi:hypothetical protein